MKNKILFLCVALTLGLVFAGCDDIQVVEFASISSPGWVRFRAEPMGDSFPNEDPNSERLYYSEIAVWWDAVEGAESYRVVLLQEGKVTLITIYQGRGDLGWDADIRGDTDNRSCQVGFNEISKEFYPNERIYFPSDKENGPTFKVGVIAIPGRSDKNPSSPKWAEGTLKLSRDLLELQPLLPH